MEASADFVPLDVGNEISGRLESSSVPVVESISKKKPLTFSKLDKKARKALLRKAVAAAVSKAGDRKHNILDIQQSKLLVKKDRRIIKKEVKRIKRDKGKNENAPVSSEHFTEEELRLLFPPKPKKNKDKYDPEKRKLMKARKISYSGRPTLGSNNVSLQSKKRKLSDASQQHHREPKIPIPTAEAVSSTQKGDTTGTNSTSRKERKELWKAESKKHKAQRKQEKKVKLQAEKDLAMKIAPERVAAAERRAQEIRNAMSTEKAESRAQRRALVLKHNKEKADAAKKGLPEKEIRQLSLQHRIERRRLRKTIKKRRIAGNLVISKKVPDEIVKAAIKATTAELTSKGKQATSKES